jgi:hypothetical protein
LHRGLLVLLAGALIGVFFGWRGAQIVGFVVAMLILCLGAMRLLWVSGAPPRARGNVQERSEDGGGLVVLLAGGIVAMVVGSRALQAAGFVVVVLIICLGAMVFLSSADGDFTVVRRGGYGGPSGLPGARGIRAASLFDPSKISSRKRESQGRSRRGTRSSTEGGSPIQRRDNGGP